MDLVLDVADRYILDTWVYPASWQRDCWMRQYVSLVGLSIVLGTTLYLSVAWLSYMFLYDHKLMEHPRFLKHQIRRELKRSLSSIPIMAILTGGIFVLEVKGYSRLHLRPLSEQSIVLHIRDLITSTLSFLIFTDTCIYWIHRLLHHRLVYKYCHKQHHTWIISTPFASHAFHPIDGFMQGLPYHIYVFLFPLNKLVYLLLFVLVNCWTVSIHDGYYTVPRLLQPLINGAAHHTDHHLFFDCNYGQFFTIWDRLATSFRYPSKLKTRNSYDEEKSN